MPNPSPLKTTIRNAMFAAGLAAALLSASAGFADQLSDMNRRLDEASNVRNHAAQTGNAAAQAYDQGDYDRACKLFTATVEQWGDADRALARAIEAGYFMQGTRESQAMIDDRVADNKRGLGAAVSAKSQACGYHGSATITPFPPNPATPDLSKEPLFLRGMYAENGTYGPVDIGKALTFYGESCKTGDGQGCFGLGNLFFAGKGIIQDKRFAGNMYAKSCDLGTTEGCIKLGTMAENGDGIAVDKSRAVKLYETACNNKIYEACALLGIMFYSGNGFSVDKRKAFTLFETTCNDKIFNAKGCAYLGVMYDDGDSVAQDITKAYDLFSKTCKLGAAGNAALGCYRDGLNYLNGHAAKKVPSIAAHMFYEGCILDERGINGSAPSCYNYGLMFASGNPIKKNKKAAIEYFHQALRLYPNYPDALQALKRFGGKRCEDIKDAYAFSYEGCK